MWCYYGTIKFESFCRYFSTSQIIIAKNYCNFSRLCKIKLASFIVIALLWVGPRQCQMHLAYGASLNSLKTSSKRSSLVNELEVVYYSGWFITSTPLVCMEDELVLRLLLSNVRSKCPVKFFLKCTQRIELHNTELKQMQFECVADPYQISLATHCVVFTT